MSITSPGEIASSRRMTLSLVLRLPWISIFWTWDFSLSPICKFHVHRAGVHVGHAVDAQGLALGNFNVTLAAVKILDQLGVLGQAVRREGVAGVHRQAMRAELALGMLDNHARHAGRLRFSASVKILPPEIFTSPTLYWRPSSTKYLMIHRVGGGAVELDVLDFKIQVAVVAIIIRQPVAVAVKIILLEIARAGQPGKRPAPPDFQF